MSASLTTSRRTKAVAATLAVTAAAGLTLASATPAQAAAPVPTAFCSVTPHKPVNNNVFKLVNGVLVVVPHVRYTVTATCKANTIVQIQEQRLEADAPAGVLGDDYQGGYLAVRTFETAGTKTISVNLTRASLNTEAGAEELYQRTRFRVANLSGVSAFTAFRYSPVLVTG